MKTSNIRKEFLDHFKSKGHTQIASGSLIPASDPTLLFTNAGMVQFKDIFLGRETRDYQRAVSVQRCLRAGGKHNDLENVGYTARHHTFFEMLGNFSFGDYFKRDAINYAWEFLTIKLGLPPEKLWVTVYTEDSEAEDIWLNDIKVAATRFSRCGKKDNFWSMGSTGPCGPCSEIFYDHGADIAGGPPGSEDEGGDRYIEIWNLVFMQYNRSADGTLTALPKPSVDTGMGLERLAAVLQQVHSNYDIDIFQSLMRATANILKVKDHQHTSVKVIADHIRACAFLALDGVRPSNEGHGYVMRRIIRRAVRHGVKLGAQNSFFYQLVAPLAAEMGAAYPKLIAEQEKIASILLREEQQFAETVEAGLKILSEHITKMNGQVIEGTIVFKLYDTYGFPVDLTADIAREKGLVLDMDGYQQHMDQQRTRARAINKFQADNDVTLEIDARTEFVGHDQLTTIVTITAIYLDGQSTDLASIGTQVQVVLDKTPFYPESGGQVADGGGLFDDQGAIVAKTIDVQKKSGAVIHWLEVTGNKLKVGDKLIAKVDKNIRTQTATNHSATHLLHAALRQVLGDHVEQKGSQVKSSGLRFDFSHFAPLSAQEIKQVEDMVNQQIQRGLRVVTEIKSLAEARESGAMALFGEKYAEQVRVLSMGDFSVELCGGTHVKNTADIGFFKIIAETGVASGVRRLEARSGLSAYLWLDDASNILSQVASMLQTKRDKVEDKLSALVLKSKQQDKEIAKLKAEIAAAHSSDIASQSENINGINILLTKLDNLEAGALRTMVDELKAKLAKAVIVLSAVNEGKITLICGVTNNITDKIRAGDIIQQLSAQIDGKGGGRADLAQGGGTNVAALSDALNMTKDWIKNKLN